MRAPWLIVGFIFAFSIFATSAWPDVHDWLVSKSFSGTKQSGGYGRATVNFSETTVSASVPLTSALERKGLAGRTGLNSREGMLFVFSQPARYPFWMEGMLIPLDFIWMGNGHVVDLTADVPAPLPGQTELPIYRPNAAATSMLEVNAGFAAAQNIHIGDMVRIDRK